MNSHWAIHVPIFHDELFSSWLVRLALTYGCDPLVLSASIWPGWRVWGTDVDRGLDEQKMSPLISFSGLLQEDLERSMLQLVSQTISGDKYGRNVVWPWILALGSTNRIRKGGLQYCTSCLAEDESAYFRKEWRYAWHTVCVKHSCRLRDKCPKCGSPIEIHRLVATDSNIFICANCKYDLRQTKQNEIITNGLQFQTKADIVLQNNKGMYGSIELSASDWFLLARFFVNKIRRAGYGKEKKLKEFLCCLGVNPDEMIPPATGLPLEYLPIAERFLLLKSTDTLMSTNPDFFIETSKQLSISVQSLKDKRQTLPVFIDEIFQRLPEKRISHTFHKKEVIEKPRPKQTVQHMWARLLRKLPRGEK